MSGPRKLIPLPSRVGENTLTLTTQAPESLVRAVSAYATRHQTTNAQVLRVALTRLLNEDGAS